MPENEAPAGPSRAARKDPATRRRRRLAHERPTARAQKRPTARRGRAGRTRGREAARSVSFATNRRLPITETTSSRAPPASPNRPPTGGPTAGRTGRTKIRRHRSPPEARRRFVLSKAPRCVDSRGRTIPARRHPPVRFERSELLPTRLPRPRRNESLHRKKAAAELNRRIPLAYAALNYAKIS